MNHHPQQRIGNMSIHPNSGRQGGHMHPQSSVNQQHHVQQQQPHPQKIAQQKHHQPKILQQQQQQPIQGSMTHSAKNVIVPMVQSQQKQQPQQHHQSQTQIHTQTNVVTQQTQRIVQAIESKFFFSF